LSSQQNNLFSIDRDLVFWVQWLVAIVSAIALLVALAINGTGEVGLQYRYIALIVLLASLPIYQLVTVYHKRHGYLVGLLHLLWAWLLLLACLAIVVFVTKTNELFSRQIVLLWAALGFVLQSFSCVSLHFVFQRYHRKQQSERISLIIGTGKLALNLAERVCRRGEPMIGLVASNVATPSADDPYPVLGTLPDVRALIRAHGIRRIYIALPMCEANQIERLYLDLLDMNVDIVWLPDLSSRLLLNHTMTSIDGMPAVYLNESLITSYPLGAFFKALLDRSLALVLIVVLSPLLMITAVAVRLSSPGPVLFKQERHGLDGKVITIWKFRSMRLHDDPLVTQASRDDLRFTRVGRFIRRASIDELPQLFNVFQGRMSLVGPRPHAVVHNDYFMGKIDAYMARHRIKPGMTGLAQISGCRGAADSLEMMKKRVEFDLAYINRWSLLLDIKILIKTPFVLFSKDVY